MTAEKIPTDIKVETIPDLLEVHKVEQASLAAANQSEVNKVWEVTQMKIALSVIWAALFVSAALSVAGRRLGTPDIQLASIVFLFGVANLVTGFYFGRTNHNRPNSGLIE